MAQVLHQRATTTHATREDIQLSTESVATLSRRYGINPKTVRKWRSRTFVEDVRMGPSSPLHVADAAGRSCRYHVPAEDLAASR